MRYTFKAERKDGEIIDVEVYGKRIETDDEPAIMGTAIDITDRRELEDELRRMKNYYQTLVEQNLVGIYIVRDGEFVYANPKVQEMTGYSEEELLEMDNLYDVMIAEDEKEKVKRNVQRRLEGEVDELEYTFKGVTKQGEEVYQRTYGKRIEIDGEPAVLGASIDITEQKELEHKLRERERMFDAVFHDPSAFMGILDTDGSVRQPNQKALDFVEVESKDVIGEKLWDTPWFNHSFQLQEKLKKKFERATEGEFVRFEATHKGKDGEFIDVEVSLRPVEDEEGNITSV
ncbi:MAG: PAS domain S-box protein, partial [Halobacteria archaeon]|nr:PAS domain S-box protein [Halobacteria archaeon]